MPHVDYLHLHHVNLFQCQWIFAGYDFRKYSKSEMFGVEPVSTREYGENLKRLNHQLTIAMSTLSL